LFLEATGLASGSWVLAAVHKKIAGFQRDEVYIGTAEERAQKAMEDDDTALNYGAGHIVKLPNFKDHAPRSLQKLLARDPAVAEYINKALDNAEAQKETEIPDIAQTSSNDAEAYCGAFYKK
jgi:hypothetical protein